MTENFTLAKLIVIILQGTRILEIKLEPVIYVKVITSLITAYSVITEFGKFSLKQ